MSDINKNRRWVYDQLTSKGVDMGSYDAYSKAMEREDARQWTYQQARDHGIDIGDEAAFHVAMTGLNETGQRLQQAEQERQQPVKGQQPKQPKVETRYQVATPKGETYGYTGDLPKIVRAPRGQSGNGARAQMEDTNVQREKLENQFQWMNANMAGDTMPTLDEYRKTMEENWQSGKSAHLQQLDEVSKQVEAELRTLYDADIQAARKREEEQNGGGFWSKVGQSIASQEGANPSANWVPEVSARTRELQAAQHSIDNAKETIAAVAEKKGFFGGMGDKIFNIETWDMGITSLADNMALMKALDAWDEDGDEALTESQRTLLNAKAIEMATLAYFSSNMSRGYKAGSVTAESLPFMIEMAINPLSGVGKKATNKMARYAIKKYGTETAKKGLAKLFRGAMRVGADAGGAAGMTLTTGAVRTAADAVARKNGEIQFNVDDEGRTVFAGHEGGEKSWKSAWLKAFGSTTIENFSEMFGEYFKPLLQGLGGLTRKGLDKIKLSKVNEFFDVCKASDIYKLIDDFSKHTKWHGTIGEFNEELVGSLMNAILVHDQKIVGKDGKVLFSGDDNAVFNKSNILDTFLGVAAMGGFFSAMRMSGYRTPKYRLREALNEATEIANNLIGDTWDVDDVVNSYAYSEEQKRAALNYAKAKAEYEGYIKGKEKQKEDPERDQTQMDAEESFENGYEQASDEGVRGVYIWMRDARMQLEERIGVETMERLDADPLVVKAELEQDATVSDDIKRAVADYVSGKAFVDGVAERINDDAKKKVAAEVAAEEPMRQVDGSMHPVMLRGKNKIGEEGIEGYLISGNVVLSEDGSVDAEQSDPTVTVYDVSQGKRVMMPASDIMSVGEAESRDEYEARAEQRRQEYAQKALDAAMGKVDIEPGYEFETGEGERATVIVVDGDDVKYKTEDGKQGSMSMGEIQAIVDEVALKEYRARRAEEEPEEESQQPQQPQQPQGAQRYVEGKPGKIEDGMVLRMREGDGEKEIKMLGVMGRWTPQGYVEDASGIYKLYYDPSQKNKVGGLNTKNAGDIEAFMKNILGYYETAPVQPQQPEEPEEQQVGQEPVENADKRVFAELMPRLEVEPLVVLSEVEQDDTMSEGVKQMVRNYAKPYIAAEEERRRKAGEMPMRKKTVRVDTGKKDKKGKKIYKTEEVEEEDWMTTTPERAYKYLYEEADLSREEAKDFVNKNLEEATNALKEAKKDTPKMSTSLAKYKQQREEHQAKVDAAQQEVDYWSKVQTIQLQAVVAEREAAEAEAEERRRKTRQQIEALEKREKEELEAEKAKARQLQKEREKKVASMLELAQQIDEERSIEDIDWPIEQDAEAMEILNDTKPRTLEEVAAQLLAKRKTRIDPESYRKHTGYNTTEQRTLPFVFAKPENGGASMEEFGEMVQEKARDEKIIFDELDANAGMNALINVLGEVRDFNQLNNYIANARRAEAEEYHSNNVRRAGEAAMEERWIQQHGGMSRNEYNSYISYMEDAVQQGKMAISEEEWNEIFNHENPIQNDTRTAETDEGSQQRSTQESGTDEPQAGQAPITENDTRGDGEEDARPEERPASPVAAAIAQQEVEENPSEGQKEAGNYKKAHVRFDGYDLTIENKKGSTRSGVDPNGKVWSQEMHNNYGYILGTEGVDGDHIDVFLSDTPEEGSVFVVDQVNNDGSFDEHKVIYGFPDMESARQAYLSNYEEGWQGLGAITPVSKEEFKKWIESSHRKTKPFSEYKSVETLGDVRVENMPTEEQRAVDELAAQLDDHNSAKNDRLIQQIADLNTEASERWLDENVRSQKVDGRKAPLTKVRKAINEQLDEIMGDMLGEDYVAVETPDEVAKAEMEIANGRPQMAGPVFVSNAMRAVEGIKQEKATAEQWLKMIEKAGGLKAGEDKWTGLSEWLKEQNIPEDMNGNGGSVILTKKEIMDYLQANAIEIEEVEYEEGLESHLDKIENLKDEYYDAYETAFNEIRLRKKEEYRKEFEEENAKPEDREEYEEWVYEREIYVNEYMSGDANNGTIDEETQEIVDEQYPELSGAFNVWVGDGIGINDDELVAQYLNIPINKNTNTINATRLEYTTPGLQKKREIALVVPNIEPWNKGDDVHFGDAGEGRAVAWVRFGETTDTDGKRVLVIDEIQSKRHQEGREKGYINKGVIEEYNHRGDMLTKWRKRFIDKYNIEPWKSDEDIIKQLDEYEKEDFINIKRKYEEAREKYQALGSVPDAPFEKNWHEVMMKRMLRYAAENGYDKVAWTTGEQQAERYNLSDQVKEISSKTQDPSLSTEETPVGHKGITIKLANGQILGFGVNEQGVIIAGQYEGRNLSDVVGKEIAKKLMEEDATLSGDGLRIGGEGMKGFYDQILPRFMDKYGKKWGVKTTDVELPNIGDNGLTMWSVDVTPEMKESVMEGQPMFHRVFHGSVADFDAFDHSHMGEGEGAQAYGWGTYVTEVEGIGKTYAKAGAGLNAIKYKGMKGEEVYDRADESPEYDAASSVINSILSGKTVDIAIKDAIEFHSQMGQNEMVKEIRKLSPSNFTISDFGILYTVDIPDDNGSNYLDYKGEVSKDRLDEIDAALSAHGYKRQEVNGTWDGKPTLFTRFTSDHGIIELFDGINGKTLYEYLYRLLGTPKDVSEFLHSIGFTGIKYPAEYRSGGRSDGAKNYVIFDEGDLDIKNKTRFFRTADGTAYGFTKDGKIYIDKRIATPETRIHEYTHLWAQGLKKRNPDAWKQLKSEMEKQADVMAKVKELYPELIDEKNTDHLTDEMMEEVFAHYSGKRGAERLEAEMRAEMAKADGYAEKAAVANVFHKLREMLSKFWNMARDLFAGKVEGVEKLSGEDFADMMLGDLLRGFDPRETASRDRLSEMDKAYMEAVEKGDMETAQRMVDEAAKAAMPDTKVVDENGMPLVVYHGSGYTYTVFDNTKAKYRNGTFDGHSFFTDARSVAASYSPTGENVVLDEKQRPYVDVKFKDGRTERQYYDLGGVYHVYLNIKNPMVVDAEGAEWSKISFEGKQLNTNEIADIAKQRGHDGVIIRNVIDGAMNKKPAPSTTYVTFSPEQIKSADPVTYDDNGNVIPLSERFNSRKDDIRWQKANAEDITSEENIAHGLDALQQLANGAEEVRGAMKRKDLAQHGGDENITFYFGKEGDASKDYKKGYGIAHIGAKHGKDAIIRAINIIANGQFERYVPGNKTVVLTDGEYETVLALTRFGNKETWLFNGWKKKENTGDNGEVSTASVSTQNSPTFSRADLGAVVSAAKVRQNSETAKNNSQEAELKETKIVDNEGKPLVLYHSYDENNYDSGLIYLSVDKEFSQEFGENTDAVYAVIKNPYVAKDDILRDANGNVMMFEGEPATIGYLDSMPDEYIDWLKENYDGVVGEEYEFVVAFDQDQIIKVAENDNILDRTADNRYELNPYTPYNSYEESLAAAKAAGYTKKQFDAWWRRKEQAEARARKRFKEFAEKLNLGDRVTFVDTVDEVEGLSDAERERRRDKKGWYDRGTGRITVVLDNHHSGDDVLVTILHEGVGHHGLRALFGRHFDTFLDNVYEAANISVRRKIVELSKKHGWNVRTATEEYMAQLAEDTDFENPENQSWWTEIKMLFWEMLHRLGLTDFGFKDSDAISDNELRYILWRSYENLVEPGRYRSMVGEAQDVAMQNRLGVMRTRESEAHERLQTPVELGLSAPASVPEWSQPSAAVAAEEIMEKMGLNEEWKQEIREQLKEDNERDIAYWKMVDYLESNDISLREARYILEQAERRMSRLTARDREYTEVEGQIEALKPYIEHRGQEESEVYFREGDEENAEKEESGDESQKKKKRAENETADIWKDANMGLYERITAAAAQLAANHQGEAAYKDAAYRAIGGNLTNLRKAMSLQKEFDRGTVKRVTDLAKILMQGGYLDGMSSSEIKGLLTVIKNATGRKDITNSVTKVMDIMIDHQLRQAEEQLKEMEKVKATKVNTQGVETQGALDVAGQQTMKAFKGARHWSEKEITDAMNEAEQRMASDNAALAEESANEYVGYQMALEYVQNIKASKKEEGDLRRELRELDDLSHEAKQQTRREIENAIRENKIERIEAYQNLKDRLGGNVVESIKRAQQFKEREKMRIREIQHNANSDMEGRPANEHYVPKWKDKFVNNAFVQFVFAPLGTFDQMLRIFGSKSANGEGYLWNRFMRGWTEAREKEIRGVREKYAQLDAKVAEIFEQGAENGKQRKIKTMGDLIRAIGKMPKMAVKIWDGGAMQPKELTQGNLMYIYMVNKMSDGRIKLRKMGITAEVMAAIEENLDQRLRELADWMQEEFLVETRNEYNETHKRMFGASMASIEDYFPLKILGNARVDNPEDLDNPDFNQGISTKTGSIIKRTRNTLTLDVTGADALNVILEHVAEMEHWNAFAEFNKELNTLRTYKRFRNQVWNMTTIYGSGEKLWKKFNDVCQMAAGTYRPPRAMLDTAALNFAKGVTAAKVSFRIFTALKQLLSMPAYASETRPDLWAKNLATPWESWNWAMENLPIFEERWKSRIAGDPRLMKSEMDWKMWRNNFVQIASRIGMSPNAFVDAVTVSIGAKSIYESHKARYLKDGYSEEQADKRAKQDAEMAYNQTQQSSEGAFLSTMQVDRSWLSVLLTVFRNASMSYTRQLWDAVRNTKRNLTPGQRKKSIKFMAKQMIRDGVEESKAMESARKKFNRQIGRDAVRLAVFGYIMQFAWNLGSYLSYLLFGDDDDEKKKMWDDVWAHTAFGWLEGFTGGDVVSEAGEMLLTGEGNPSYLSKDMPLTSDITKILREIDNGHKNEALNDIINLVVQSGIGVNPQSITDAVLAFMDACGDDPALAHEATIAVMRILQVPQSQIKKMYFDEVGLSGDEVSKYTPDQLAERYAKYQVKRGRFFQPWEWDNEVDLQREKSNATKRIKERVERIGDAAVNEEYVKIAEELASMAEKEKAYNKAKKSDYVEAARIMSEIQSDVDTWRRYLQFKRMDKELDKLAKEYLNAKSVGEAETKKKEIEAKKKEIVDEVGLQ